MAETTERPMALVKLEWNPNTGAMNVRYDACSLMEALGVINYATHAMIANAQKSAILPAPPLAPHLIRQ